VESIELRLGAALVRLQLEPEVDRLGTQLNPCPGAGQALREWWLVTRKTPGPPESFGWEVRLASCCHSTERQKGESRDKTPFVVGRCAKPQHMHRQCSKNVADFAICTSIRASGEGAHKRELHNKRVRKCDGRRATEPLQTRGEGSKTQEAECKGTGPAFDRASQRDLFLAENGEEANHRLNSLIEIRDMELLIGGVNVVIGQA
jgi:hypothetical protein